MKMPPYIFNVNRLWFFPKWVDGFAFFPFIFIKNKEGRTEDTYRTLVEHEKIHINQQIQGLLVGFLIKYFIYNMIYGYKKNPYEVEAYKHQDDWKKNETFRQ